MKEQGVSKVELLGGGSRIPAVMSLVTEALGVQPSRTLNSSESLAKGAGLSAAMSSGIFRVQPYYAVRQARSRVVLTWRGAEESMQNEADQTVIFEKGDTILSKKSVTISV